jgi:3-hydroxybutyryl-CoA dehydrogenase
MKIIGIIGAGVMGRGVAQSLAQSDYQVILVDITEEILKDASAEIFNNVRFQGLFTQNKTLPNPEAV